MRRYLYGSATCAGQNVKYYLLVTPITEDLEEYGISVDTEEEYIDILSLSISWRRVERILSLLMNGCVTPVTAFDVVEDLIA